MNELKLNDLARCEHLLKDFELVLHTLYNLETIEVFDECEQEILMRVVEDLQQLKDTVQTRRIGYFIAIRERMKE